MQYFHSGQTAKMRGDVENRKLDAILQKNFPDNTKWGACVNFYQNSKVDFIEINKLSEVTQRGATWTHYATICACDEITWELYSQFNGAKEDELWVLGYYKNFGNAVRRVKLGIEKLKPIKVY